MQLQIGTWFITVHWAKVPQEPGQGSLHFSLIQAWLREQSEFTVHSGRQFGGLPIKFGKQEQEDMPLLSRHSAFGPQGDGMHGLNGTGTGRDSKNNRQNIPKKLESFV